MYAENKAVAELWTSEDRRNKIGPTRGV